MQRVNDYFAIDVDAARRIVRIVRSALPAPPSATGVASVFAELRVELEQLAGYRALLDMRALVVGRSDPSFEAAAMRGQQELMSFFLRVAVLVRTAAGKLQARRMNGGGQGVFQDEAEAVRFLTGE